MAQEQRGAERTKLPTSKQIKQNKLGAIKPLRFVLPIASPSDAVPNKWHVLVRTRDVETIRVLIEKEAEITHQRVREWFHMHARAWPPPIDGESLDEFLLAMKALLVSKSQTVADHRSKNAGCLNAPLHTVRDAIHLLADNLPTMVLNAYQSTYKHFSEEDLKKLSDLATASQLARNFITAPDPSHREAVWHDDARLIEWHLRKLLAENGHTKQIGYAASSPLSRLVVCALAATGCTQAAPAVNRVMEIASKRPQSAFLKEKLAGHTIIA